MNRSEPFSDNEMPNTDYDSDDEATDNRMSVNTNLRDRTSINSKCLTFKSVSAKSKNKLDHGNDIKSLVASIVGLMKQ